MTKKKLLREKQRTNQRYLQAPGNKSLLWIGNRVVAGRPIISTSLFAPPAIFYYESAHLHVRSPHNREWKKWQASRAAPTFECTGGKSSLVELPTTHRPTAHALKSKMFSFLSRTMFTKSTGASRRKRRRNRTLRCEQRRRVCCGGEHQSADGGRLSASTCAGRNSPWHQTRTTNRPAAVPIHKSRAAPAGGAQGGARAPPEWGTRPAAQADLLYTRLAAVSDWLTNAPQIFLLLFAALPRFFTTLLTISVFNRHRVGWTYSDFFSSEFDKKLLHYANLILKARIDNGENT